MKKKIIKAINKVGYDCEYSGKTKILYVRPLLPKISIQDLKEMIFFTDIFQNLSFKIIHQ